MQLDAFALSIPGRRSNNEDAVCSRPELGLFVVADGLGGYDGGEIASEVAIDSIHALVRRTAADADVTWPYKVDPARSFTENEVIVATKLAGARINALRVGELEQLTGEPRGRLAEGQRMSQMATTVAVLRIAGSTAVIGHVGDSRVYRLRDGVLTQLTIDHSLVSDLIRAGHAPDANFAWRHVITRALGMPAADPDVTTEPVQSGDTFLLCSDGLYEPLELEEMAALMDGTCEDACRRLVDAAYHAGSRDNISAIVVRAC